MAAAAGPVLSAATGDRTLRLSGEVADGTIVVAGTTRDEVAGPVASSTRDARPQAATTCIA